MSKSYKPDNYSTVSPYLVVDGAAALLLTFSEDKRGGVKDFGGTTWWIAT